MSAPLPVRTARPTYGNGVAVATTYDAVTGAITALAFCASSNWRLGNTPDRGDISTCATPGKLMQATLGNSSWTIEAPALGLVGLEASGLQGGAICDLFFFTTQPTYSADGTVTNKGVAHWVRSTSCASDETGSNAAGGDVQRLTFTGDSGTVIKSVNLQTSTLFSTATMALSI